MQRECRIDSSVASAQRMVCSPDLAPEDLFETISQCLLAAVDRDCLSGWGAVVHVITKDGVTTKRLVGRMD